MSIKYWPYWDHVGSQSSATTTWSTTMYSNSSATAATGFTNSSSSHTTYYAAKPRNVLVSGFDGWSESMCAEFTKMVNDDTSTGFRALFWFDGGAQITDPDVDVRDVTDFLMLMRVRANLNDAEIIDAWRNRVTEFRVSRDGESS